MEPATMSDPSKPEATTNQGLPIRAVALLLLAVAVIAGGLAYGVVSWQYRSMIELKDAIASQQTAIQTMNASLDKLRADNAELRSRIAAAEAAISKSARREPDAIYQMGAEVGRVTGAREDRASSTVTFESIEGGNFDRAKEFEYRDLTLIVKSHKSALTSFTGRGVQTQLTGVVAAIVRTRAAP
jgi:outer membrane murein-binding lipoprotein Lpp